MLCFQEVGFILCNHYINNPREGINSTFIILVPATEVSRHYEKGEEQGKERQ